MTEFNWDNFIEELKKFQKGIENIGGYIRETKIEIPVKEEEILDVEQKLGYRIPEDFRDILLNYSSYFEYYWDYDDEKNIKLPNNLKDIFSGDLHWGLDLLLNFEESRQGWVDICYPNYNDEYDKVWHNKLALYEVGNGDYFAIELEKENYGKIVYLSHDGGDDWQWEPFYMEGKGIDSECENAKLWREYIFSKI